MITRVLLTTRSAELSALLDEQLRPEEAVLVTVDSADEMWEHLGTQPCDLIAIDEEFLGSLPDVGIDRLGELPEAPQVIVLLGSDDAARRAELLQHGALAAIAVDIDQAVLARTIIALVRRAGELAVKEFLADEAVPDYYLGNFTSKSEAMRDLLATARKVVDSSSTLLVLGETGVGKEFLASAIHAESSRSEKPFVGVSCASLPEALLEAELFGHVEGAFTGATRGRRGYFELANTGTLFLDEIGELPLHLQVKLLRVLQDRVVQPVGAEERTPVDVRVIAATNRDLKQDMEAGRFRSDLYFRLSVVTLKVPTLVERREDVPDLVLEQIERFRNALGRPVFGIRPEALGVLQRYSWPGNVRELINVIERAVLLADGEDISLDDLPEEIRGQDGRPNRVDTWLHDEDSPLPFAGEPYQTARTRMLDAFERRYFEELLIDTRGRVGAAAQRAGISARSLYEKMKRLGLRKETFRSADVRLSDAPSHEA
jgi:DNA-binding NtrC family response regulator